MENSPYLHLLIQSIMAQEGSPDMQGFMVPHMYEGGAPASQEEMAMLMMLRQRFNLIAEEERARQFRDEAQGIINHPESLLYHHLMEEANGNPQLVFENLQSRARIQNYHGAAYQKPTGYGHIAIAKYIYRHRKL